MSVLNLFTGLIPSLTQPAKTLLAQWAKHAYNSPWFELRETLMGLQRHNLMSLSAALSFYALFALIPLIVLIFFLLSHLVYSSDYAIVKLAILTGNLLPEFSQRIMVEVFNNTQTKAAWGVLGFLVLLWTISPLATNMRNSFYIISSPNDAPSFWSKKFKDILAVLGILLLFFLFTAAGFILETVIKFAASHFASFNLSILTNALSLLITTLFIATFYHTFSPLNIQWRHLMFSAFITASIWVAMRPAFGWFLTVNEHFGAVFGSMKAMFVSITWLYLNFAAFLFGIELMVTLRKKQILMLKGLFGDIPNQAHYIRALMHQHGRHYVQHDTILREGEKNSHCYVVVEGTIHLVKHAKKGQTEVVRILKSGDYFGEIALLSAQPASASAIVASAKASLIEIDTEDMENLLHEEPKIALRILRNMSNRVQISPSSLEHTQHQ